MIIRQAHPGPKVPHYERFEEKFDEAARFKREENIPYPVTVDDLPGTVHQVYGSLADPCYLIDVDGRVAYYNMWTSAPTLHKAIEELLSRGRRGIVQGAGVDRLPHVASSFTDGWKGLRKGLPQSWVEMELASPGIVDLIFLGYQIRPLLAPITLRGEPLPKPVKIGLTVGALAAVGLGVAYLRRRRS